MQIPFYSSDLMYKVEKIGIIILSYKVNFTTISQAKHYEFPYCKMTKYFFTNYISHSPSGLLHFSPCDFGRSDQSYINMHSWTFIFIFILFDYFFFSGQWAVGRFLFRERTSHLDYCSKVFKVKIRNCLDYNHPTFFRLSMHSSTGCLDIGNYLMPTLVKPGKITNMQITTLK